MPHSVQGSIKLRVSITHLLSSVSNQKYSLSLLLKNISKKIVNYKKLLKI